MNREATLFFFSDFRKSKKIVFSISVVKIYKTRFHFIVYMASPKKKSQQQQEQFSPTKTELYRWAKTGEDNARITKWAEQNPKAVVNTRFNTNATLMSFAAMYNQLHIVQMLDRLDHLHRLLWARTLTGNTPLDLAVSRLCPETARWLLKQMKPHVGENGFFLEQLSVETFVVCDDVDELRKVVDALFRIRDPKWSDSVMLSFRYEENRNEWLRLACEAGSLNAAKYLVEELGADPKQHSPYSYIVWAVKCHHLPVVQWLMQECGVSADLVASGETRLAPLIGMAKAEVLDWMLSYMTKHTAVSHDFAAVLCQRHFLFTVEKEIVHEPTPERPQRSTSYTFSWKYPTYHTAQILCVKEIAVGLGFCRLIAKALLYEHIITARDAARTLTATNDKGCPCRLYIYIENSQRIGPQCMQVLAEAIDASPCNIRRVQFAGEMPTKLMSQLAGPRHRRHVPSFCKFPSLLTLAAWAIRDHIMKGVSDADDSWQQHPQIGTFQPPNIPQEVWERLETVLNAE